MTKINLGKIKVWIEAASWYYGKVMQIVTAAGVLKLGGVSWWVLGVIFFSSIPALAAIVYLHMKYVYPSEVEYTWRKNPVVKEFILKGRK